jgi:hypothetical protein
MGTKLWEESQKSFSIILILQVKSARALVTINRGVLSTSLSFYLSLSLSLSFSLSCDEDLI